MTAPTPSPEEFAKYIDRECRWSTRTRDSFPENAPSVFDAIAARDAALLAPLREEVERLREALAFYANPDTYRSPSSGFALQYDPMPKPIEIDHGGRAQRALKKL